METEALSELADQVATILDERKDESDASVYTVIGRAAVVAGGVWLGIKTAQGVFYARKLRKLHKAEKIEKAAEAK